MHACLSQSSLLVHCVYSASPSGKTTLPEPVEPSPAALRRLKQRFASSACPSKELGRCRRWGHRSICSKSHAKSKAGRNHCLSERAGYAWGPRRTKNVGAILLVIVRLGLASQLAVALDDTYLRCKGSVAIFRETGVETIDKQEIAAHVMEDRISVSGNGLLLGTDIPICRHTDEFYFDSQSCEGGPVDLSRRREYGTLNKITGELHLSNQSPQLFLVQGSFICKKTEPLMK
jgi:hypothetical protein